MKKALRPFYAKEYAWAFDLLIDRIGIEHDAATCRGYDLAKGPASNRDCETS